MRHIDTFFPGYRRKTFIDGCTILCNTAGETRLKLSMKIPLSGDQLVGMPTWVSAPFGAIAKSDYAIKSITSAMVLDPMLLHVFGGEQSEKELIAFEGVRLAGFKVEHDNEDEHPNIILTFTAYVPRTGRFLKFADDHFGYELYVKYEPAQQSLLDDNPNVQTIDAKIETEDDEEDELPEHEEESPEHGQELPESPSEPPDEARTTLHTLRAGRRRRTPAPHEQEPVLQ